MRSAHPKLFSVLSRFASRRRSVQYLHRLSVNSWANDDFVLTIVTHVVVNKRHTMRAPYYCGHTLYFALETVTVLDEREVRHKEQGKG